MAHSAETARFDRWLRAYGEAWEARDSAAAVRLFSPDAAYHWTPFDPPFLGRDAIAGALDAATSRQSQVRFEYQVLAARPERGVAWWRAAFVRIGTGTAVRVEGVLTVEWDQDGLCRRFREWWNIDEPGGDKRG